MVHCTRPKRISDRGFRLRGTRLTITRRWFAAVMEFTIHRFTRKFREWSAYWATSITRERLPIVWSNLRAFLAIRTLPTLRLFFRRFLAKGKLIAGLHQQGSMHVSRQQT